MSRASHDNSWSNALQPSRRDGEPLGAPRPGVGPEESQNTRVRCRCQAVVVLEVSQQEEPVNRRDDAEQGKREKKIPGDNKGAAPDALGNP